MKRIWFLLFALLVTVFIVSAMLYQSGTIGAGEKIAPGAKPSQSPPAIAWHKLEYQSVPTYFKAVGTVRSREEVAVVSRLLSARVTELPYRSGEHFRANDILVRLEDRDLAAGVDAAAENLKAAESRLAFAEAEFQRYEKLSRNDAIAKRIYEQSASNRNAAKAEVAMLKQELLTAKTNLDYATIRAPFDGVISERSSEPGDLATPLNVLLKIFNPAKLQFRVPVREGLVTRIKIGDILHARIESTGKTYPAEVREIVPSVDAGSRSFLVNACLQGDTAGLMPGMFAVCEIPTGSRNILTVPKAAVQQIGQLEYLEVKNADGQPIRQLIKTTPAGDHMLEIISGAAPGDEYAATPSSHIVLSTSIL